MAIWPSQRTAMTLAGSSPARRRTGWPTNSGASARKLKAFSGRPAVRLARSNSRAAVNGPWTTRSG